MPSRRKRQSRFHLRPEHFGRLRELSQDRFEELRLPQNTKAGLNSKAKLDQIITGMNSLMDGERNVPTRSDDRARIQKMRAKILPVIDELRGLGRDGKWAIRSAAGPIADMLSIEWFRRRFPNDEWPSRWHGRTVITGRVRQPMRGPLRSAEQIETDRKYWFVQNRTTETLLAVLREIEAGLVSILTTLNKAPRAFGGREPLRYRHIFLINLAEFWHSIGKSVLGGPDSRFADFCENVVYAVGWPTEGLRNAVPDAIKGWREWKSPFRKLA
jgi:hypothetical protein